MARDPETLAHQEWLGYVQPVGLVVSIPALLAAQVLGWDGEELLDATRLTELHVTLPEYHEALRPTFAVKEIQPKDASKPWMMLIQCLPTGTALDEVQEKDGRHWQASPHAKFERLLRETEVPLGLLSSGTHLRLVYAPRGDR